MLKEDFEYHIYFLISETIRYYLQQDIRKLKIDAPVKEFKAQLEIVIKENKERFNEMLDEIYTRYQDEFISRNKFFCDNEFIHIDLDK